MYYTYELKTVGLTLTRRQQNQRIAHRLGNDWYQPSDLETAQINIRVTCFIRTDLRPS